MSRGKIRLKLAHTYSVLDHAMRFKAVYEKDEDDPLCQKLLCYASEVVEVDPEGEILELREKIEMLHEEIMGLHKERMK